MKAASPGLVILVPTSVLLAKQKRDAADQKLLLQRLMLLPSEFMDDS
jgi:hypothetical protein